MLVRKEYNTDGTWMHMYYRNGAYLCELYGRDETGAQEVRETMRHHSRKPANDWMDAKTKRP